jgi:hypothetical protein
MSSVLRSISQVHRRNLTVVAATNVFTLANIQTATATNFKRLSPTLYIANNAAALTVALGILNAVTPTVLENSEETVQDLGTTVRIGLPSDPNMLVLRLVRRVDVNLAATYNTTGYVVIENKSNVTGSLLAVSVVAPGGGF